MSEAVEYDYKYKASRMVFSTITSGFFTYIFVHGAILHPASEDWTAPILTGAVFAFCALNVFFLPLSDKTLRLTETELQIPYGWPIKKTCKIPFDEIERIELAQGSKSRHLELTILRRKVKILVGEEKLPNADAFDKVSKILFEETKKYTGQTTMPLRTEKTASAFGLTLITVSRPDKRASQEKQKLSDNQDLTKT